jgi:hypothetical protein
MDEGENAPPRQTRASKEASANAARSVKVPSTIASTFPATSEPASVIRSRASARRPGLRSRRVGCDRGYG